VRTVNSRGKGDKLLPQAGRRVEALMRSAMRETDHARTVTSLAEAAQVQRQTVYDIWHGRSPKPGTVEALMAPLGLSTGSFWEAWEGREGPPEDALRALVDELRLGRREQLEMNRAIAAMLGQIARAVDLLALGGRSASGQLEDDAGAHR
jgi:hypothetical protein